MQIEAAYAVNDTITISLLSYSPNIFITSNIISSDVLKAKLLVKTSVNSRKYVSNMVMGVMTEKIFIALAQTEPSEPTYEKFS